MSSSISLFPSNATRLTIGFSTMTMTMVDAFTPDAHVLEQAGGEQRLQQFVDLGRIVSVAGGEGKIRADRLRLDALVAFDPDGLDDALGMRGKIAKARAKTQRERDGTQHKEGREQPSGQRPPHHFWCLPLEADPRRRYGLQAETGLVLWPIFDSSLITTNGGLAAPAKATFRPSVSQKFQVNQVIPGCKNHQHENKGEPYTKADFLACLHSTAGP